MPEVQFNPKLGHQKLHIQKIISDFQNRLREPINYWQIVNEKKNVHDSSDKKKNQNKNEYWGRDEILSFRDKNINGKMGEEGRNLRELRETNNRYQVALKNNQKLHDSRPKSCLYFRNTSLSKPIQKQLSDIQNDNSFTNNPKMKKITNSHTKSYSNNYQQDEIQNGQLYKLMTQILYNQKNLQKQVGMLRTELNKEQTFRYSYYKDREDKISCIKGKDQQIDSHEVDNVFNSKFQGNQKEEEWEKKYQYKKRRERQRQRESWKKKQQFFPHNCFFNKSKSIMETHPIQTDTLGIQYSNMSDTDTEQQQKIEQQIMPNFPLKPKNHSGSHEKFTALAKKSQPQITFETQQKLSTLLKNQNSHQKQHVISQQFKHEFWKQVFIRIRQSQKQYKESVHRNSRYQQDHLVNANELQKKMKEDILGKIYAQCNQSVYK